MDNATRLTYLEIMGVDVWLPRYTHDETDTSVVTEDSWLDLNKAISHCQACDLCATRASVVLGIGDQQADILWVTEAPNLVDEQQANVFVDENAKLFDEMLRAMGCGRDEVFITHIVKCRPPDDRDPKKAELLACSEFLTRQILLLQPKLIMSVGRVATQTLTQSKQILAALRGQIHYVNDVPMVAIYHPAYLLRKLTEKPKAWNDMQLALTCLNES